MKKKSKCRIFICSWAFLLIVLSTNVEQIRAEDNKINNIEVSYLLGNTVDYSKPINKNFLQIKVYYQNGIVETKQGVGTVFPYVLLPEKENRIIVEYEGVQGELYLYGRKEKVEEDQIKERELEEGQTEAYKLWGKENEGEENKKEMDGCEEELPKEENNTYEQKSKEEQQTETPQKDKADNKKQTPEIKQTAIPVRVTYSMITNLKNLGFTTKKVKKYSIYTNRTVTATFGTSNIKKIQYQLVKKGNKKIKKWKTLKQGQLKQKAEGAYVLYIRFYTTKGKIVEKHTKGFVIDQKTPTLSGVKNGETYAKKVKLIYKDNLSGVKNAYINKKKFSSGTKIEKNGTYKIELTDKAGNCKRVEFRIATPTPKPTLKPTIPPTESPITKPVETEVPYVPVSEVSVSRSIFVKEGKTAQLNYKVTPSNASNPYVTFTSTNEKVVTVDANGEIHGKEKGVANVVVRSCGNSKKYAVCVVYVQ